MHKHLDLTTEEAVARLQGNWSADVAAYDQIHRHILHMSDSCRRPRQAVPEAVPLTAGASLRRSSRSGSSAPGRLR